MNFQKHLGQEPSHKQPMHSGDKLLCYVLILICIVIAFG
jgi:hypothetical protein